MTYYLAETKRDTQGNVTGYDLKFKLSSPMKPRGDYEILFGPEYEAAKAVFNFETKQYDIVEDTDKKASLTAEKNRKRDLPKNLKKAIDDATSLADIKVLLKSIIKEVIG